MKNMNKIIIILLSLFMFSYIVTAEETNTIVNEDNTEIIDNNDSTDNNETASKERYANPNTGYKVVIEDDAMMFLESAEDSLEKQMIEFTEYGNIAFKTINENYTSTSGFASQYYHSLFGSQSGSLFLIDMDNREIYIFSDGNNYKIITSDKAYSITDNVYKYASNGQYYECTSTAFDQMLALLKGNKIMEPMRYISNILISITCAAFLNYFFVIGKSKIKKASDKEILDNCQIDVQIGEITVRKTGQTKVYSPVSDSSSGSSGGHSGGGGGGFSGGGGSSGGGGGHRF